MAQSERLQRVCLGHHHPNGNILLDQCHIYYTTVTTLLLRLLLLRLLLLPLLLLLLPLLLLPLLLSILLVGYLSLAYLNMTQLFVLHGNSTNGWKRQR